MRHSASLLSRGLDVIFPPVCALCRTETLGPAAVCAACWSEIGFLGEAGCRTCDRPVPGATPGEDVECEDCLRLRPVWQRGRAVFGYEGAGRRLVLALKHGDRLDLVPLMASWLCRVAPDLIEGADLIVPVPLHWTRRLKRRFNQAAALAHGICRHSGVPRHYAPRHLVRIRRTASQDGRDRAGRATNVAGAFALDAARTPLDGKRVLLVDDVMTTGATLNEAARVCLAAGAGAVDILVLALVLGREHAYIGAPVEDENENNETS